MNKFLSICTSICVAIALLVSFGFGANRKIAQTGMKFLVVSSDARLSAMSSAATSLDENGSEALFYNPSSMANAAWNMNLVVGQTQWIAGIDYTYGALAYRPDQGQYGVFGLTFMSADYGDLMGTIRAENEQGYLDVGTFSPSSYAIGIGYAKALSSKFSVGGHAKYVNQDLVGGFADFSSDESGEAENFEENVWAFDFGILYKTGYKSLNFGMSIRNFSQEIEYIQESLQLPLTFEMGLSMNVLDFADISPAQHSLLVSIDAAHPRDFEEQLDFGFEYMFNKMFALRMGYTTPTDEQGLSFGLGFNQSISNYNLKLDYSYTDFGVFENINRFTLKFSF